MTRSVRPIKLLAGAVILTLAPLATAACGGGGATASMKPPKAATAATTTVGVATSGLGKILVDSQGRTLYLFKKDSGTTSACTGACASAWPPLLVKGKPEAVSGASASLLGTTTRPEGTSQVTYNGHPLYLFVKDQKPGDTNGQGLTAFGAAWFAVTPAGAQVGQRPSATGGSPARKPAVSPAPEPKPTPEPAAPKPAPEPAAPKPAPQRAAPPAPKPAPPAESGIPQNNGGDGDADNNGGPSDGDGAI